VAPAAPSLASAFQPRYVDQLIPAFHDAAARRIAHWDAEGVQSRNLLVDFRALTLAIAARAMFSIEDDRQTAELANLMNEGERRSSFLDWRDFLFLLLRRGIAQPSVRRAFGERWRGSMASFLENRPLLAQLDEARDFLDLLRTARDQCTGGPFRAEVIVDQVGTMMAAGFETTAVALFWIALLLAFFPNQQEAIRGELCAESVDAPPKAQFLRSLPTTTAFVYEALRLYPPFYNFLRQAAVDDRIGDLSIPRGATISISPWVLHRHQRHWEHPHRFDPRRFFRNGRVCAQGLDAVRRWAAHLHRHGLRHDRNLHRAADSARALPHRSARPGAATGWSGRAAAGVRAELHAHAPLRHELWMETRIKTLILQITSAGGLHMRPSAYQLLRAISTFVSKPSTGS
jgi:cytochrome P450